jgi:hypothetical protein
MISLVFGFSYWMAHGDANGCFPIGWRTVMPLATFLMYGVRGMPLAAFLLPPPALQW